MEKRWIIALSCGGGALLIAALTLVILWHTAWKISVKPAAVQIGQEQQVEVTWNADSKIDKVKIDVTHKGTLVSSKTLALREQILTGKTKVDVYYGEHTVKVTVYDNLYTNSDSVKVKVFASEYNIAPLTATMPVTIFSLVLNEISQDVPTFAWFKRSGAWDWSNLPKNVYAMPIAKGGEFYNNSQVNIYRETSKWVKELYDINPESKFNLFYNDYYAYGWMDATVANGIPASNYKVHLISDGTASFSYFNNKFNVADPDAVYEQMKTKYLRLKDQVAKKGNYYEWQLGMEISAGALREYAYVMATEESNVEWWLSRISGTLNSTAEFYNKVAANANVKVKDLKTLLTALSDEQKTDLKTLYKFSDNMFSAAVESNKKAMMILGTWTDSEDNFADNVHATMDYYGDKYIYYYKGHPRNPTNAVPGKAEKLAALGLIDLDATIPAELIMFFNPDIFLSGYPSSTFVSATEEMSGLIWNQSMAANAEVYKDNIDAFVTKIDNANTTYASILDATGRNYLVEAVKPIEDGYEFAIYNAKSRVYKYYKTVNDVFEQVKV